MPPRKGTAKAESNAAAAKAVDEALKKIKTEGVTFRRAGAVNDDLLDVLPTGIFGVDHHVLGAGGFQRGRVIEVYGVPSGGKGTLVAQLIAETQRLFPEDEIAYVDAENALSIPYLQKLGVNTDKLILVEGTTGEENTQGTIDVVEQGNAKLVIVDSVASLVPRAELEGEMADCHVGLQARLMGQCLRKLTPMTAKTNAIAIFLNQTRSSIGVTFGNPKSTPGGEALKFFSSVRLQIDRIQQAKYKAENVGNVTKIKSVKNKTAAPFRDADVNLYFDLPKSPYKPGFDNCGSLADFAIEYGVWKKSGSQYTLAGTEDVITGRDNLRNLLADPEQLEIRRLTTDATLRAMGKNDLYIKRTLEWMI